MRSIMGSRTAWYRSVCANDSALIMLNLIIFLLGSLGFIILSRHALTKPSSHGFPRFFAFEALLSLVILNTPVWFVDPFSLSQLVSWGLLLFSLLLAVNAFWIFQRFGKVDPSIPDDNRLGFEKTTDLITEGPYRFIRHPMYASLLYLAWGVYLKQLTITSSLLVILVSLALYFTSVLEERENLRIFGDEYAAYKRNTRRFIPFLF
jgi:protein-S-isoprenylcysteine O-methyltransferase Ste14